MEMIDRVLLEEMGIELNLKQWATDWGWHIFGRSPRLPSSSEFTTIKFRIQKAVIFTVAVCYSKRIWIKINIRKRHIRQGLGEFKAGSSSSPFPVVMQTALTSPSNDVWQQSWSIANQGNSPKPWCPGFFLGVGHIDMADCRELLTLSLQTLWSCYKVAEGPHPL